MNTRHAALAAALVLAITTGPAAATAEAAEPAPQMVHGVVADKWYESATRTYGWIGIFDGPECWGLDVVPDVGIFNRPVCVSKADWDGVQVGGRIDAPELRHAVWRHFT